MQPPKKPKKKSERARTYLEKCGTDIFDDVFNIDDKDEESSCLSFIENKQD